MFAGEKIYITKTDPQVILGRFSDGFGPILEHQHLGTNWYESTDDGGRRQVHLPSMRLSSLRLLVFPQYYLI